MYISHVNYKLLIETGRYTRILGNKRLCGMVNARQLGNEFHFLVESSALKKIVLYQQIYL